MDETQPLLINGQTKDTLSAPAPSTSETLPRLPSASSIRAPMFFGYSLPASTEYADTGSESENEGVGGFGGGFGGYGGPVSSLPSSFADGSTVKEPLHAPLLGIPLVLPDKRSVAYEEDADEVEDDGFSSFNSSLVTSPMAVLVGLIAFVFAVMAGVYAAKRAHKDSAASYFEVVAFSYWAGELAVWVAMYYLVGAAHRAVEKRFYLAYWFYLIENTHWAITSVLWAGISLVVTPYLADSLVGGRDAEGNHRMSATTKIQVAVVVIFAVNIIKFILERIWLLRINATNYGQDLAKLVKDEEVVCNLTRIRPENENLWVTPRELPHTHSLRKTLLALLGQAMGNAHHTTCDTAKREAAAVRATDILTNLDVEQKGYFTLEDMEAVMRLEGGISESRISHRSRRAMATFTSPGVDVGRVRITHSDAAAAIFHVFARRQALYLMLHDRGAISNVLHRFTGVIFWLLASVGVLVMFDVDVMSLLLPIGTSLLGLAFVFGSTAQRCFEGFILCFLVVPYAIGDRITVDGGATTLIVSAIYLLTTHAHTPDGRLVIIPNGSVLFNSTIINYRRSKDYAINAVINIRAGISAEVYAELERRVVAFFNETSSVHPWDVDNNFMMWLGGVNTDSRLSLNIWIGLKGVPAWSQPGIRLTAQTVLYLRLQAILTDMAIPFTLPVQPVLLKKDHDE